MINDDPNCKSSVSVRDVARLAGVSIATVSRSFNKPDVVKKEVREKIFQVAASIGYQANTAAKTLRSKKSYTIGAVIPTLDHAIYAKIMKSFQEELSAHGYALYIVPCGFDASNIFENIKFLLERGVDAILFIGSIIDKKLTKHLLRAKIPVICTYSYHKENPDFPFIGFDNYKSTIEILEYLYTLGHKDIAMISGPTKGNDRQITRTNAFNDFMKSRNLSYCLKQCQSQYDIAYGQEYFYDIMNENPNTTAIICSSDILAFGVMSGAKKINIKVPERLTIIGYDNLDFSKYMTPSLTTLDIPAKEMGLISARKILSKLRDNIEITSLELPTKIIIRDSSNQALNFN
ncbi:catabolite control protein A [Acinetobacter calcoaceticus]